VTRITWPIDREVKDIEKTEGVESEYSKCIMCRQRGTDFKLIQKGLEDTVCMECLEEEVNAWIEDNLDNLKQALTRYNVMEEL